MSGAVEAFGDTIVRSGDNCVKNISKKLFGKTIGIHDVFMYETPKLVRIRDARLGCLYLTCLTAIAGYLVIEFFQKMEYLEWAQPEQNVLFELKQPVIGSCSPTFDPKCEDDFSSMSEFQYCCNTGSPLCETMSSDTCHCPGDRSPRFKCRYRDALEASRLQPPNGMMLMTYKEVYFEQIVPSEKCDVVTFCKHLWTNTTDVYRAYTADVERFSLTIEHSIILPARHFKASSHKMHGRYIKVSPKSTLDEPTESQKKLCLEREDAVDAPYEGRPTSTVPCYILVKQDHAGSDTMKISDLLDVMGIDLMQVGRAPVRVLSWPNGSDIPYWPLRFQGFVVSAKVTYFNSWPWQGLLDGIHYYYEFAANDAVPSRDAREFIQISDDDVEINSVKHRRVEVGRGIEIKVVSAGQIGEFSFESLLITLTRAMTLMAVATLGMNFIARSMLQWSDYYRDMIYDSSGDFGPLPDLDKFTDEELTMELKSRGLEEGGYRVSKIMRLLKDGWKKEDSDREDDENTPLMKMDVEEPSDSELRGRGSRASSRAKYSMYGSAAS